MVRFQDFLLNTMVIIKVYSSNCQLKVILLKISPIRSRVFFFLEVSTIMTIKTNVQTLENKCFKYSEITVSHFQIHAALATVLFFVMVEGI